MSKVSEIEGCKGCPLAKLFPDNNFIPPQMGPSFRLVIGEAPGEQESLECKPLVGGSGRIFNMLYRKAGVPRESLTILNILQCRPLDNIFPTDRAARQYISEQDGKAAVKQCLRNHVIPILESRPWTRLDLIGNKALEWMTGLKEGILKWRGSPLTIDTNEIKERCKV